MTGLRPDPVTGWLDRLTANLANLRRRSHVGYYTLAGTSGALFGLLAAVLVSVAGSFALTALDTTTISESVESALLTGLGLGTFGAVLSAVLFRAMRRYQRRPIRSLSTTAIGSVGFVTGLLAGFLFQLLFNVINHDLHEVRSKPVMIAAAILIGVLVGMTLSRKVPNLSPMRGLIAGLVAGLLSGLFIMGATGGPIAAASLYLLGFTILGTALGLGVAIFEARFRNQTVEVAWETGDTTRVGLGVEPVTIGGGWDDIYIPGAPAGISSITIMNGRIEHLENATGRRTVLKDGSRLRVNGLVMVVHAPISPSTAPSLKRQGR